MVLALGDGRFAQYMHLEPGSLRVTLGDRVKRGQVIAQVGSVRARHERESPLTGWVVEFPALR